MFTDESAAAPSLRPASIVLLTLGCLLLLACTTPQREIESTDMTTFGSSVRSAGPPARLPSDLAVCRVQRSWRGASDSVVASGEACETDDATRTLASLAGVRSLRNITPLQTSGAGGEESIRAAAAQLGADLTLIYTFSASERNGDFAPPLGFLTIGLFPTKTQTATATCSGVVVDTRTGAVYATAQGSYEAVQLANGWTTASAKEDAINRSLRLAFSAMVDDLKRDWNRETAMTGLPSWYQPGAVAHPARRPAQGYDREWWVASPARVEGNPPPPPNGRRYFTREPSDD